MQPLDIRTNGSLTEQTAALNSGRWTQFEVSSPHTNTNTYTHTVKLKDDKYYHLLHFSTSFYIKKSSIKKFKSVQ